MDGMSSNPELTPDTTGPRSPEGRAPAAPDRGRCGRPGGDLERGCRALAAAPFGAAGFPRRNLAVGLTFSAVARNQLQAMQMTFFFFLPSGFMLPFRGMPGWAQAIGEVMPLTHFLRIVHGILLKGNGWIEIWPEVWPLLAFAGVAWTIAILRYRRTLD